MSKTQPATVAGQHIKSYVDRVEKLSEERQAIGGDIRDVYAEAKGNGYDVKTIRWLVQERKIQAVDRDERDALRDTYAMAIGMAVNLVQIEGLSLREAAKRTGTSKSSVHRALAVPAASHDPETGEVHDAPADRGRDIAGLPEGAPVGEVPAPDEGCSTDPGPARVDARQGWRSGSESDEINHSGGDAQDESCGGLEGQAGQYPPALKTTASCGAVAPMPTRGGPPAETLGAGVETRPHDTRPHILPSKSAWQAVTAVREAHHARIEVAKEARRQERQREREALVEANRRAESDDLKIASFLRRSHQEVGA